MDEFDDNWDDDYTTGFKEGQSQAVSELLENMSEDDILALLEERKRDKIIAKLDSRDNYGTEYFDEDGEFTIDFAHPGANSALRAAHAGNPRILPCPTCGTPNSLTPADKRKGYQCDRCADRDEGIGYFSSFANY